MNHHLKNARYLRELGGALLAYALVLIVAMRMAPSIEHSGVRLAILVSPMLPCVLIVLAIVRHLRRIDEFIRQSTLEHIAIAAATTAGWTLTYGFLEGAGLPRLSMFTVWPMMAGTWAVAALVAHWRNR